MNFLSYCRRLKITLYVKIINDFKLNELQLTDYLFGFIFKVQQTFLKCHLQMSVVTLNSCLLPFNDFSVNKFIFYQKNVIQVKIIITNKIVFY